MNIIEFDPSKYRLGKLCKRRHEWKDTGFSLRNKSDNHCLQCNTILQRIRKPPKVRKTLEQRFWERVDKSGDCWDWQLYKNAGGYGQINVDDVIKPTHRVAWELTYGEIPEGMKILHKCDRPSCCNPSHLMIGTQADNIADMFAKGRQAKVVGEKQGSAKLTENKVREIRQLWNDGGITKTAIAKRYGVSTQVIWTIISGKGWKHLN